MYSHRVKDTNVLRPVTLIAFFLVELVMLLCMIAIGFMSFAVLSTDLDPYSSSPLSASEVLRALTVSLGFMILSGYAVSVGVLTVVFRNGLLSRVRALCLALLFVVHAVFFLFYLRGPAVPITAALLIAIGVASVLAVIILENIFWRRWLQSRAGLS